MAAFDRVLSGIPALDQAPDPIRMGDNVVWRVSDPDEFRCFAGPFVEQAKKDGRNTRKRSAWRMSAAGTVNCIMI